MKIFCWFPAARRKRQIKTSRLSIVKAITLSFLVTVCMFLPRSPVWGDPIKDICNAASSHDIASIKKLLEINPGLINAGNADCDNDTPLMYAVISRDFIIVKYLVETGADVNLCNGDGISPLHIAAALNDKQIAEFLISNNANVNSISIAGTTPLFASLHPGYNDMIVVLINNGAAVNIKDKFGLTPLQAALQRKLHGIADLLRKHGAKE